VDNVKDYVELVKAPWGRMFYDLLFAQLNIPQTPRLKILDFGSGLGVTANYFANWHDVTAIEPNTEMIENRYRQNCYTQICGGIEKLSEFKDGSFHFVFCHNVLEYIEEKEPVFAELVRLLASDGILSIVKHNQAGKVFQTAVFKNDPKKALTMLNSHANEKSNYLGTQYLYSNSHASDLVSRSGGKIQKVFGMRNFWALGQDNSIKYSGDWYQNMLTLECEVADMDEYKQTAFYNHLLIGQSK